MSLEKRLHAATCRAINIVENIFNNEDGIEEFGLTEQESDDIAALADGLTFKRIWELKHCRCSLDATINSDPITIAEDAIKLVDIVEKKIEKKS